MPNTTNYSFPTPADTDLVKNGADAIRDLGDAVDTAMNTALGTKKSGLVLLNTTSFSGVSSISLPANTFTSTYQHYFIQAIFYCDSSVNIRMRAAGSDNSTANSYQTEFHYGDANSSVALYSTDNIGYGPISRSGEKTSMQMFVYEPYLAAKTYLQFQSIRPPSNMQSYNNGIIHTQTVSYDSMSFISGSGNFATGSKISVYGMNQ